MCRSHRIQIAPAKSVNRFAGAILRLPRVRLVRSRGPGKEARVTCVRIERLVCVVAGIFICLATIGCSDQKKNSTPYYRAAVEDVRQGRGSPVGDGSAAAPRDESLIVQARLVSVGPTTGGTDAIPAPPPGESSVVTGDLRMRTLSSIETLARVGAGTFRAQSTVGSAELTLSGTLDWTGYADRYRVKITFSQDDAAGTVRQSTVLEMKPDEPRMVAGMPGRAIVLTLKHPAREQP
jgi:hypothetical protein